MLSKPDVILTGGNFATQTAKRATQTIPIMMIVGTDVVKEGVVASLHGMFRQAATHAARILKGANPAELPIEQASRYELILNMKTAKALGVQFPHAVLLRAERVIE